MSRDINMPLAIDEIVIPDGRREVDPAVVKRLADSIDGIGLRHPITVRKKGEQYVLVAGRHRIEAFKKLEREHIQACIVSMTHAEARMWEIAENLHRAELTKLERAEQIDEWRTLMAQVGPSNHPAERGIRKAAEALGVSRQEVERSASIASITPEAKEAAQEAGFADNQSKLLEVAKEAPERQVAKVLTLRSDHPKDEHERSAEWRRSFERVWNNAPNPTDRDWAKDWIDRPIMDRSFG